ncbi:SacI homology domain-containing protein [Crucibulum laeve]|uniref:SacI homology domain-containing protein n=1 Tax=Crucibulum laeve TaxID=68775 RepID=A0A5C3MA56_9AGAR|nr:SacI homology domain-containing protein [Crucibulum laeve]
MKKFIAKASQSFAPLNSKKSSPGSSPGTPGLTNPTGPHTTGLQPKYTVPAVPHPCPHDHLEVIVTKEALLVRPNLSQGQTNLSYVKIAWSKAVKVEEIEHDARSQSIDWKESTIVYGLVGFLELFSGSYLLVISSRSEVGNVIDATHAVYGVKGVTAIPLSEERARITLNTLSSRNTALARPSLLPTHTLDTTAGLDDEEAAGTSSPHVQFSEDPDVKQIPRQTSPYFTEDGNLRTTSSAQSSSSDLSTPSSERSVTSPVFKALATRLSFWNRVSKRNSLNGLPSQDEPLPIVEPMSAEEEQATLDRLMKEGTEEPAQVIESIIASTAPAPATVEERHSELEDKIVRECVREFTKGGMYFAYTFDITRSLQHKQEQVLKSQKQHALLAGLGALPSPEAGSPTPEGPHEGEKVSPMAEPYPTLPLWRRVDKQFWWNEWLSKPLMDAGLHSYVLPIVQGYFQVAQFALPPDPVTHDDDAVIDYIIVSRRSRDRAGLRYQRRGIDDDAHVANFVETETIMRVEREGKENIFSYVQIRGSIPLYWTQTGYGLKPPPLLAVDRTHAQNLDVLKRHFRRTVPQYGPHTIINLAEQHGREGAITQGYRDYMQELNSKDTHYCEYDFHVETKGMKYENISKLIESMERTFEAQGYLWISDNTVFSQQKGVFRVNCIDCLDRTNVVQSAFARYVLNKQLSAVALLNPMATGKSEIDTVFNDVWANNGDAISRAYAGTSALKGDFTRTGKRDLSGMLNDGVNSLARMYTSTFSDWFCQAVIDFMLGNRTLTVFSEFLLRLQSSDPRDLIRLSKIRAEAIATSVSRVLPEGERLLSGWTLFAPEDLNVKMSLKFEEKVLLLSTKALYIISYDYTLEKVKIYTRVPLGDIIGISKGAYILSPLEEASRDPEQNAGFVVTWVNSNQESRVTSYSLRNSLDVNTPPASPTVSRNPSARTANPTRKNTLPPLANLMNKASIGIAAATRSGTSTPVNVPSDKSFAAFKVLPIDPARIRRASSTNSGMYADASDELSGAGSCREAVDLIVDSIYRACEDAGSAQGADFVKKEDVVSLAEAQRMTSMYAKMEYGVKRLLWLGG